MCIFLNQFFIYLDLFSFDSWFNFFFFCFNMNLFTQSITNQPYYSFIILLKWLNTLFQKPQLTHLKHPRTPYYLLLLIRNRFVKYLFWFIDSLFWKLSKKKTANHCGLLFSWFGMILFGKIPYYFPLCFCLRFSCFNSNFLWISNSLIFLLSVMLTEILFLSLLVYFVFLLLFAIF